MPIAVISGASRGALRKPPVGDELDRRVERGAERHRDQQHHEDARPERRPPVEVANQADVIVATSIPPSMKTSPWAKLISSRMP